MPPNFDIHLAPGGSRAVIRVSGELDLYTAPQLAEQLARSLGSTEDILVDLEQLEFMDCAGVRVLVQFTHAAEAAGVAFGVTPGSRQVQRLFELTEVGQYLHVVETSALVPAA